MEEELLVRIRELEEKCLELTKDNERKEREKMLNFDSRLYLFEQNVSGSQRYLDNSGESGREKTIREKRSEKKSLREKTICAKDNANTAFTVGGRMLCVICGSNQSVSVVPIITLGLSDYSVFGVKNNYISEIDVFSVRNFMPICGANGPHDSCRDAIDKHHIHIFYDVFQKSYQLSCSPNAHERFQKISRSVLITPAGWNPYRRLLAWRSRKCGTEYGFIPNFPIFETMNQISEESNSIGDLEIDDIDEENEDSSDDDCLDDEKWYSKHSERWSESIEVSGAILLNPVELQKHLTMRIEKLELER